MTEAKMKQQQQHIYIHRLVLDIVLWLSELTTTMYSDADQVHQNGNTEMEVRLMSYH
jgi:hypothetical protein